MNDNEIVNLDFNNLEVFQNNKLILLTTFKLAHSWCRDKFLENKGINSTFSVVQNNYSFKLQQNSSTRNQEYFYEIQLIWNSLLEKKEKRDIVVLYRNPIEHLISGFMQDFSPLPLNFNNSEDIPQFKTLLHSYIYSLESPTEKKDSFIQKYLQNGITEKLFINYPILTKELIKLFFDYYLINAKYSNTSHFNLWLTFISNMYYSNLFDKNKFKFIDIYDDFLEIQLENYLENSVVPARNVLQQKSGRKHNYVFDYIKDLIHKNKKYYGIVSSLLYGELLFYEKIKNNKL